MKGVPRKNWLAECKDVIAGTLAEISRAYLLAHKIERSTTVKLAMRPYVRDVF
jgi:hypothetical protein